ncbi:MAG: hypothetical protein LBC75_04930 [Fibromonadaceae bacterium]|jgi:TolB-like protein|nr:hypothetical protein [Fibromonadaceae bacterium]
MKHAFILLFLAIAAYAQTQERVAIINTLDDRDSISVSALTYLTDRLRETAVNVLPAERFGVMTTESIVAFLGSMENTVRVCKESSCLAELGRQVSADYVSQGRIGRFNDNLTIKVELYSVISGNLMGSFTGESKDIAGLRDIINENAADLFKKMLVEPKPIVVGKPEVAKLEPVPAKPEAEMPKNKTPFFKTTSFWVAVALDAVGAAIIYAGILTNNGMKNTYDQYNVNFKEQSFYEDRWPDVEYVRDARNVFYIVGGVLLASGIGVHIWF